MSSLLKCAYSTLSLFLAALSIFLISGAAPAATMELGPEEYDQIAVRYWDYGFVAGVAELENIKKAGVDRSLAGNSILELGSIFLGRFRFGEKVFAGESYLAVRTEGDIYSEDGKRKVGGAVSPLALVQMLEIRGDIFRGKIVELRRPVLRGDYIVSFKPQEVRTPGPKAEPKNLGARIVASRDGKTVLGPGDVFYIDMGRANGLRSGQLLEIFSRAKIKEPVTVQSLAEKLWHVRPQKATTFERPDLTEPISIGRATVASVRENTAAAVINRFKREILLGDIVRTVAGE